MSRVRRILLVIAVAAAASAVAAWVVLHSAPVQRRVADRVAATIEEGSGWRVEIDQPRLRLWPARLTLTGVRINAGDRRVATIGRLEASWRWRDVAKAPHRVSSVELIGVSVDLNGFELPESAPAPAGSAPVDPWRVVEVGRLRIVDGSAAGGSKGLDATVDGLRVSASLVDAEAAAEVTGERLTLRRQQRELVLGPLAVEAAASPDGIVIEGLDIAGDKISVELDGEIRLDPAPGGRMSFRCTSGLKTALGWWDPNLASGLDPDGVLELAGWFAYDPEHGPTASVVHRGDPIRVAGYELTELELGVAAGVPEVAIAGPGWGRATVSVTDEGIASVSARLRDAPVERLLAVTAPRFAAAAPGPIRLSGSLDGTVAFPVAMETLSGMVDLTVTTSRGELTVAADGAADRWTVHSFDIATDVAALSGSGRLGPGGRLSAVVELQVDDVGNALRRADEWISTPPAVSLGGGPVTVAATVTGTLTDPRLKAQMHWPSAVVDGVVLDSIHAEAEGGLERVDWRIDARAEGVAHAAVDGLLDPGAGRVEGSWSITADRLDELERLLPHDVPGGHRTAGMVEGSGEFSLVGGRWRVDGGIVGSELAIDDWRIDRLDAEVDADPDRVALRALTAELAGGAVTVRGEIGAGGLDAPLAVSAEIRGLRPEELAIELPEGLRGTVDGRLDVTGTIARPGGSLDLEWTPADPESPAPSIGVAGTLEDGVLRLASREVETDVGVALARAAVPLGGLPLPAWMWPEAPAGAVRITADGHDLRSAPIAALLGIEPLPVTASAELTLDAAWDPERPDDAQVLAELHGFRLAHPGGDIVAEGPLVLRVNGGRVGLEPVVLTGPQTRIEIAGEADTTTGMLAGRLDAEIAPSVARLIPVPVQIYRPIRVDVALAGSLDAPRAEITIDHPGGALVIRDPPLFIRDLVLSAELIDGRLWVNDGRAEVNQGWIELGGGWDQASGQGLVAEVEDVVVFLDGILSQWTGAVAIEPEPGRLARVTGELNLVAGLWDQDVNLGGALFGPAAIDPGGDDPLFDVVLDLDVRGRGNVRVENNLGRFDARWDVLRVTGSGAEPEIRGTISVSPGGRISVAGQRVTVRRGSLVFTGDPATDPIVEIVPEADVAVFGAGGDQIDATALATQGLVGGLAGALGFENETLHPAEVSVEVERDSSEQLMLGQRISHNIAVFFASNTRDVQDRTSLLQLWNLSGLKGLAIQGFQKTLTDEVGGNVIQRFQWGGRSLYEDRPMIRKLKLDGDWPISKRRLRRATGFRSGQPYDPFLTFVAKVRMERELAGAGFQEARVSATAIESGNAWTMRFECDPGPQQPVVFEGEVPPRRIREQVTALYQPPPLERLAFRNMAGLLDRYLDSEGFPEARVVVERRRESVVAEIRRGAVVELSGPVLPGAPADVAAGLRAQLGSAGKLALLSDDEVRARRAVTRVLASLGYPDAVVRSVSTVAVGDGKTELRIDAELGRRAVVERVVVTGDDPLGLARAGDIGLSAGAVLDRGRIDLVASRLRAGYDAAGYSDAEVAGSMTEIADGRWQVTFDIRPGRRRTVRGIEIVGLKHTGRKVLRSGVAVEEGEILRNSDLDLTAARIANFAPIERVDVRTEPEGTDGAKVVLEVTEKPRWTAEIGGGWSTERGAQVRFGMRDDNLLGRGLSLNLRGRWDRTEWLGFVVASLPPPPGRRYSFTSTIGFSRGDAPQNPDLLDQDEGFWSFEATRWLGRGDLAAGTAGERITAYYRYTRTRTYGLDDSGFIPIEIDTTVNTGLFGARYVHDRFDSPFDPTSGYGVVLDVGTSRELLGSDFDYWTALATGSTARSVLRSSTWIQSLRIGAAEPLHGQVLIDEARFFAGGQGSIRGFDRNSVGPTEFGFEGPEPAGGGALVVLNEELRIPIKGGLRAAVFADIGQVWQSWGAADWQLAVGAGVGVRWATPIGPVWADVAWPVANRGISSAKAKFYVGIGRPF